MLTVPYKPCKHMNQIKTSFSNYFGLKTRIVSVYFAINLQLDGLV